MTKKVIYFFMLALSLTLFAGCGDDDDDDDKVVDYATQIAGTYNGALKIKIAGQSLPDQTNNIILSRTNVNKIKLELKGLELPASILAMSATAPRGIEDGTIPVGDIVVDGIDITKKGDDIVMADKNEVEVQLTGLAGLKVKVTVAEGKVSGKTLTINKISVPEVGVEVSFSGTK